MQVLADSETVDMRLDIFSEDVGSYTISEHHKEVVSFAAQTLRDVDFQSVLRK